MHIAQLAEAIQLIRAMWNKASTTYQEQHY
jgi:hypothetical protein